MVDRGYLLIVPIGLAAFVLAEVVIGRLFPDLSHFVHRSFVIAFGQLAILAFLIYRFVKNMRDES